MRQVNEQGRRQDGVKQMKRDLSIPLPKYDSLDSMRAKRQLSKQKQGKKSFLNYSKATENDKHEVNSSASRGTHKSHASGDIVNINTKEGAKDPGANRKQNMIEKVSNWKLEKFAFDLQQQNTEFHRTMNGSEASKSLARSKGLKSEKYLMRSRNGPLSKAASN